MDTDLVLTLGLLLLALSLPSFLGGFAENRLSRLAVVMFALSAGMIGWAIHSRAEGLSLQDIPDIVLGVVARLWSAI